MRVLAAVVVLFIAASVHAQGASTKTTPPSCSVGQLATGQCAVARMGTRIRVTNTNTANDTNCASGTGAVDQICEYNGSAWVSAPVVGADAIGASQLSANSVTSSELNAFTDTVILCGENDENGTIYFGPSTGEFGGNGADLSRGGAACDALDGAEGAVDEPILAASAFKVTGFYCTTDATLGAGESIIFTLRSAEANLTPSLTCTIGAGATQCSETDSTTTNVAAGATLAVQAVESSNNADGDESWCRVGIVIN